MVKCFLWYRWNYIHSDKKQSFMYTMFRSQFDPRRQLEERNRQALIRYHNIFGPYNRNVFSGAYDFEIAHDGIDNSIVYNHFNDVDFTDELSGFFDRVIEYIVLEQGLNGNDLIQIVISSMNSNLHIWSALLPVNQLTGEYFLDRISDALSSYQEFDLVDAIVTAKYYKQLRVRGGHIYSSAAEFCKKKKCVVRCHSNMCVWEAIMLGLSEHDDKKAFEIHVKKGHRRQLVDARTVRDVCALEDSVAVGQFPLIERKLKISILLVDFRGMRISYGDKNKKGKLICLLQSETSQGLHVDYVKKDLIGRLWERAHFCKKCFRGYAGQEHKCIKKCMSCKQSECEGVESKVWSEFKMECEDCHCKFYNDRCFMNHKRKLCVKYARCTKCNYMFEREVEHECNKRLCHICSEYVSIEQKHQCYHQVLKADGLKEPSMSYIFYDYETYLDSNNKHVTAAIIAWDLKKDNYDTFFSTGEFVEWLLKKEHKGYTCIAHNCGRYDYHFIKQELLCRGIKTTDVSNGNTIFYSSIEKHKMRFIDSYKLIPIPLRAFPKSFGLKEISKGYFPYRFLTESTRGYVGPMPEIRYFEFDKLKEKDRKDAMEWYESKKGDTIHLMDMCLEYCVSDVVLLKEGCMKFRNLFMSITNNEVDPLQYITIASVCMTVFRRFHLTPQSIGIIEAVSSEQTKKAAAFKAFTEGENKVLLNCVDNGCERCTHPFAKHPKNGLLMKDIRYASKQKYTGQNIVWEHELDEMEGFDEFLSEFEYIDTSVNIRESFCGGHTEPYGLYKKCNEEEKIRYVDYTSLYPSVQFGKLHGLTPETYDTIQELHFPCGHPVEVKGVRQEDLHLYFGFVKCDIECPEDLMIPILPEKKSGKLMFDLEPKRGGQWTIMEVVFAMKLGYEVTKIYSVLHFPDQRSDLFQSYVKTFLKVKTEAAGWNNLGCTTEGMKQAFIEKYNKEMGILLDRSKIQDERNDGLYLIAKLCLNSLWGKYAQRNFTTNSVDVFTWKEVQKVVDREDVILKGMVLHGDYARTMVVETKKAYISAPAYTNIAIAAFTTAHARCRLHEALHILDPAQVLYVDTDSIIYIDSPKYKNQLVLGPNLGDLTDELEGDYIEEFVSTGPKCYAYRTHKGKECVKVKGVSLNHETSKLINFDTLVSMVKDPAVVVMSKPLQFVIDKQHNICTKEWNEGEGKRFRLTMNKRKIDWENRTEDCIMTVPKKQKEEY